MQPSTYETLKRALASNNPVELKKAAEKCRDVLKARPHDAAFLHLMGVIEFQLGHAGEAAQWIKKVLVVMPDSAQLHCLYGAMMVSQKKHSEAIVAFKRSIAIKPDYAPALYGLGGVYKDNGDEANAIRAYNDALAIDPNYHEALNDLGVMLKNKGALTEAADCFSRAIAARPDDPLPLNNLGMVFFSLEKLDAAEDLFRRALALKPDYPEALNNLGTVLHNRGAFVDGAALYRKALAMRPDYPSALNNLGLVLYHRGAFDESISLCERALDVQPKYPEALNNLGNALEAVGKLPEAIAAYKQAIAVKSDYAEYHKNLGIARLAAGRFDEGWREYEWRWETAQFSGVKRDGSRPPWRGEAVPGSVLLIRAEQGFGDTLQFCRYAPLAKARGFRVVMEVQPALVKLMGSLAGVEQVIGQGRPLPDYDSFCPMMSLPLAFATRLETIPAGAPYLAANAQNVALWRNRLPDDGGKKLKVGLVWAGKPRTQSPDLIAADHRRSMEADMLAPLMDIDGVRFFSLQKDGSPAPKGFGLVDLMAECGDFADTAALIANLDLVISVDTAMVHLAGALGKPVWMLNRFDSCWRWLRGRDDSPWYPALRLFRQPSPGDWKSVVSRVGNELRNIAAHR
jgi:tetratricopeptide (TPR) repeat protein